MGFNFRKSFKAGPFRINLSKSGIGYSVGGKGFRLTKKAGGGFRTTSSIPGTGIRYTRDIGGGRNHNSSNNSSQADGTGQGCNRGCGCAVGLVLIVLILGAIGSCGGDNTETSVPNSTESTTITETMEPDTEPEPAAQPEPNTSEKVDALALEAKAAVAEGVTDAQRDEAVTFIVDHYPDYYTDNEVMEQAMAYGFWLEYAYQDDEASQTYAELGTDVSQGIKYVYRGAETVEDATTQESLRQIQEHLEELGLVEQPDQQEVTEPTTEAVSQEPTTETTAPVTQPTEQLAPEPVAPAEPQEEMVWIPASGSKYHRKSSCSGMEGPRQVTKSEAISMGFDPCGRCY